MEQFCFLLAQRRPQIPSGPAGVRGPGGAHPRDGLQCELSGRPEGPWDPSSTQPRSGQRLERWVPTPAPLPNIQGLRQKDPREITGALCMRGYRLWTELASLRDLQENLLAFPAKCLQTLDLHCQHRSPSISQARITTKFLNVIQCFKSPSS